MLVYANHLTFEGAGAEEAIFKAIGGWLKERLGYGLHPDKLRQEGEYNHYQDDSRSWLRIYATDDDEPSLYAWVLRHPDETVHGRQWITELGLKIYKGSIEFSCIVKTEEHSTLIASPVMASRPRVVGYVANNIHRAGDADFAPSVSGVEVKAAGEDENSYRALLGEMEREGRNCPIVLVSPTREGTYLLDVTDLQRKLVGLAQVVEISQEFNSYEMVEVMGQRYSAWNGAVNILYTRARTGVIRNSLFLSEDILAWGNTQHERVTQLLAWVTNHTNTRRQRDRIRPEGVVQLALRRRLQAIRVRGDQLAASQVQEELGKILEWTTTLEEDNNQIASELSAITEDLNEARDEIREQRYANQALKSQLEDAGGERSGTFDVETLLKLVCSSKSPSPLDCLDVIEDLYGAECIVLESARDSARSTDHFVYGRRLLDMLRRLVTEYRNKMIQGSDSEARKVFGKNEYAAKESETVMENKAMRRQRTFEYEAHQIEMFRHLKMGVDDNATKTIRVHFHWDSEREKIVIGYCGKHLPISSR